MNTLGHAPAVDPGGAGAAIRAAAHAEPGVPQRPRRPRSPSLLCRHGAFDQAHFTNSGSEANEAAIKLARKWGQLQRGGAHEIITFRDAFHGRTLATMSASGKPGWDRLYAPQVPGFPKAQLNDLDSVVDRVGAQTVAIMLEPVQGESGVHAATPAFLQGLRELCDRRGLLLIFDEVQTGIGRLGHLVRPPALRRRARPHDAGQGPGRRRADRRIAGPPPCLRLRARRPGRHLQRQPLDVRGRPGGACRKSWPPGFLEAVRATGDHLGRRLQALSAELGPRRSARHRPVAGARPRTTDRRRRGGARARPPHADPADATGLLLNAPRPGVLRFMPALTVGRAEVDRMIDGLRASLLAVAVDAPPAHA